MHDSVSNLLIVADRHMGYGRNKEEPPEIITDPVRIASILENVYQQRSLLSISFQNSAYGNNKGTSLIVEINKNKKHLLLNKLDPEQSHTRFLNEKKIQVRSFYSGVRVTFDAELKMLMNEGDDLYYLVKLPNNLSYHQKRTAHRANTSSENPLPITIQLEDETDLEGVIEDISIGGLSITFTTNIPQSLQIGKTITSCSFTIPDNDEVTCELNIRFIQHNHENSPPKIGVCFENLPQPVHRQITHFVMALDRERIRTSTK